MPDKIGLTVLQSELWYQLSFSPPSVRLLTLEGGLHDRLLIGLNRFSVAPGDIRIDSGLQSLAEAGVTCWLFKTTSYVRVRADRLEVGLGKVPGGVAIPDIIHAALKP